ncbi:MAG: hypothetical protein QXH24_05030 [Candidatus Bathyarchaeia archaeon]
MSAFEKFFSIFRGDEETVNLKVIREEFWILNRDESFTNVLNLLISAERPIEIFSPWELFLQTYYRFLRDALDCLLEKGVDVRLYFPYDSKIDERICRNIGLRYKRMKTIFPQRRNYHNS